MSTRSDVGIALKSELVKEFDEKFPFIAEWSSERMVRGEGVCYVMDCIRWDSISGETVLGVYAWLRSKGRDNYKVVEMCHDYPDYTDGEAGEWEDNPWNLRRVVTTSLGFDRC